MSGRSPGVGLSSRLGLGFKVGFRVEMSLWFGLGFSLEFRVGLTV